MKTKKHYKLTSETKVNAFGVTLFRIELIVDFKSMKSGTKGGWVEKEKNLSGNAWVSGNAEVYGNAWVYGNARVSGNAEVSGNAWVSGNAEVSDNAWVYGDARVSGNARVSGDARVYGNARVSGDAEVSGNAWVYGNAMVSGDASKNPVNVSGLKYNVTITDFDIRIGCQFHAFEKWKSFKNSVIEKMDGESGLEWWKKFKDVIFTLAKDHCIEKDNKL